MKRLEGARAMVVELKRGEDPHVVLNQLYQYSPIQDTFSIIFLALVDGKPRELTIKEMLQEFVATSRDGDSSSDAVFVKSSS